MQNGPTTLSLGADCEGNSKKRLGVVGFHSGQCIITAIVVVPWLTEEERLKPEMLEIRKAHSRVLRLG